MRTEFEVFFRKSVHLAGVYLREPVFEVILLAGHIFRLLAENYQLLHVEHLHGVAEPLTTQAKQASLLVREIVS
jgi:hypothetical protein